MVLFGGACVALFRGCVCGFIQGGVHGFIWGGMRGFIWGACVVLFGGVCMVLFRGACVVLSRGACMVLFRGAACVVFPVFSDTMRYCQWAGGTHPTGMHSCGRYIVSGGSKDPFTLYLFFAFFFTIFVKRKEHTPIIRYLEEFYKIVFVQCVMKPEYSFKEWRTFTSNFNDTRKKVNYFQFVYY